jgi:uncharacterized protein (TIGR03435 family)
MTIPLSAQQSPQPAFEVASIKRNHSGETRIVAGLQPGGRYVATNIPLRMLIMRAYRLLEFRLAGGPDWINIERYDIVGLAPGATSSDDITPCLQSLPADRFNLTMHVEKREMPVLRLVLARKDGHLGAGFRQWLRAWRPEGCSSPQMGQGVGIERAWFAASVLPGVLRLPPILPPSRRILVPNAPPKM